MSKLFGPDTDLKEYDLYVDLDVLESQKTAFRLHGQLRVIKAINTGDFLGVANAFARLKALAEKPSISGEELHGAYLEMFSRLCDPFNKDDLDKMSPYQCAALYQTIEDHVMGRFKKDLKEDSQKKNSTLQ
jgi:hypothetical protein